jgi:L-amino acid N-acyltransferase YncA
VIELRHANMSDSNQLFVWRNEPGIRAASRNTDEVSHEDHATWMKAHVEQGFPCHIVMIAEADGRSGTRRVGVVRFDADRWRSAATAFDVSIAVSPAYRGFGIGLEMLAKAVARVRGVQLLAEIRRDNVASQVIFEACGFKNIGFTVDSNGSFINYRRERQP